MDPISYNEYAFEKLDQVMEAAQAQHGDICWYDGVTDQHYENGKYYKLAPQPPEIIVIDLTDCPDEPEKED